MTLVHGDDTSTPRAKRQLLATSALVAAIALLGVSVTVSLTPSRVELSVDEARDCGRVLLPPHHRMDMECNLQRDALALLATALAGMSFATAVVAGWTARRTGRAARLARLAGYTYATLPLVGLMLVPVDQGDPMVQGDDHAKMWVLAAVAVLFIAGIAMAARDAAREPRAPRAFLMVVAAVRTAAFALTGSIAFNSIWVVFHEPSSS